MQLQQVLLNLIVNAIEAMSAANNRPRDLTIVSAQSKDGVVVEVRDSGIGLDPDRVDESSRRSTRPRPKASASAYP